MTEYIEWTNTWIEDTENPARKPRLLLVGDSISRDYRPYVREGTEKYLVDNLATSRTPDQVLYLRNLKEVVEGLGLSYDVIHFNFGLHGWHLDDAAYRTLYREIVGYLIAHTPCLLLALSTPVWDDTLGYDNPKEETIVRRNAIVSGIAEDLHLPLNDLHTLCKGRAEYRCPDGLHYLECGARAQAAQILSFLP
ncbi:MAG: SGNH/GDSL hydrolase family protein [Clostridia bacterium]|nr:SGNH/GDSL hydrolase family protein [Clostridia bacterium]